MAWTKTTETVTAGTRTIYKETGITLPSSATTEYSSEITFLGLDVTKEEKKYALFAVASTVSGTNLDIAIYGAYETSGTKYLMLDAIVADLTSAAPNAAGIFDANDYPAVVYYLAHTSDANESANTISYYWVVS